MEPCNIYSKYAKNQDNFSAGSAEALRVGLSLIEEAQAKQEDLSQVFFTCLDKLAQIRHDIAIKDNSDHACEFGRWRLDNREHNYYTPLWSFPYQKYHPAMVTRIQKMLKGKIAINEGEESSEKLFTHKERALGRNCSSEVKVLYTTGLQDRRKHLNNCKSEFKEAGYSQERCDIQESNYPPTLAEKKCLEAYHEFDISFKAKYPEAYANRAFETMATIMNDRFPWKSPAFNGVLECPQHKKGVWINAKVKIQIENKMYTLSQYITWTNRDGIIDPAEKLLETKMLILHQDRHLTAPMLQEISKVFREALMWNRERAIAELRNNVGLIRYLFSHAMPFNRGSAAIGEWIEKIIYISHGFNFDHRSGTKGDLEALTAPLWTTFIREKYHTTISLS